MKLYEYQKEYYNRAANFDITNKSRKIGFSSCCIAPKSVRRVLMGIDQLLLSASQRQSNELMRHVEVYIDNVLKPSGMKLLKDTSELKIFPNGKAIHCLPSKPETVRGFKGDVRLDEFSLHREDEKIFEAMLPTIVNNKAYQLSVVSTPLGCQNMFHELMTNTPKYPDFVRSTIDCYEAIRQGATLNIEAVKRNYDEESFRQEFECEFIDESTSYFPYDLLKSCIEDFKPKQGKTNMGIDIGRTTDRTGIAVITEDSGIHYLSLLETLHNKGFDTQKELISKYYKEYGCSRGLQDKGSIGYQLSEELEKQLSGYEGVFTNQVQFMQDVVTFCKMLMEQGKLKYQEDRELINDFHKIKKIISPSNNTTFRIERDKSGHGDRAIAVMLALYAFKSNNSLKMAFV